MTKNALITGITGQDGVYLAHFLLQKNYNVTGVLCPHRNSSLWALGYVGILDRIHIVKCNLLDYIDCQKLILEQNPDEVYNLAAQSSVAASFREPANTMRVNTQPVINLLESIRTLNPKIKFYQASSSEMYGQINSLPVQLESPFNPISPYAVSKVAAHHTVSVYRDSYGLYAVSGILYNHESVLRGAGFFTHKVIHSAIEISLGKIRSVSFGKLNIRRDFGYAPDYVKAIWLMVQQEKPQDLAICSGRSISLESIVEFVFNRVGSPLSSLSLDQTLSRPNEICDIYGDPKPAHDNLGWTSSFDALETMALIVDEAISMTKQSLQCPALKD